MGSISKREEPGKTGAPCVQVPGSSRVPGLAVVCFQGVFPPGLPVRDGQTSPHDVHTGLGSSSLVAHVSCTNKTHTCIAPDTSVTLVTSNYCRNKHTPKQTNVFSRNKPLSLNKHLFLVNAPREFRREFHLASLVRDGQTSPHRPRLVVSRSTCPPPSPPSREQLCNMQEQIKGSSIILLQ